MRSWGAEQSSDLGAPSVPPSVHPSQAVCTLLEAVLRAKALRSLSGRRCVSPQAMAQEHGPLQPGAGQPCVFKLVLLGSGSVGKSSLALRYVKNDFKSILPTVGCK